MISINLDEKNYINIRSYTPSFIKLYPKGREDCSSYIVLGSKTLTSAFIKKYELEHIVSELMAGTIVVLPNVISFREEALKELRQFRYDNLAELPDFRNFKPLKNSKNYVKTLVNLEFGVVSLELYETGLLQKKIKKLLGELRLASWFRVNNYYYSKKREMSASVKAVWKHRFSELGLSVEFKEVDENLEVAIFTMEPPDSTPKLEFF